MARGRSRDRAHRAVSTARAAPAVLTRIRTAGTPQARLIAELPRTTAAPHAATPRPGTTQRLLLRAHTPAAHRAPSQVEAARVPSAEAAVDIPPEAVVTQGAADTVAADTGNRPGSAFSHNAGQRAAGARIELLLHASRFKRQPSGFDAQLHPESHLLRILCSRDRGVHEDAVRAQFHRNCGV